jgi:hypothetical protein
MRIPYLAVVHPRPSPALGGRLFHYRPVIDVRLTGPHGGRFMKSLLDTGADETVFPEDIAIRIGIDLTGAEERQTDLVGRPAPVRCRYAAVQLQITDGSRETYQWTAVVGFVATRLRYNLLGHGGFLQFFDVEFRGAAHEMILIPNASFSGTQLGMSGRP